MRASDWIRDASHEDIVDMIRQLKRMGYSQDMLSQPSAWPDVSFLRVSEHKPVYHWAAIREYHAVNVPHNIREDCLWHYSDRQIEWSISAACGGFHAGHGEVTRGRALPFDDDFYVCPHCLSILKGWQTPRGWYIVPMGHDPGDGWKHEGMPDRVMHEASMRERF